MTPLKKCNRPGGICNRSCMGGGVVGSPERECPFPEQTEPEDKHWPLWVHAVIWIAVILALGLWSVYTSIF